MAKPKKTGRPSEYDKAGGDDKAPALARSLVLLGATETEIATAFGVCLKTITNWEKQHPLFRQAILDGRVAAEGIGFYLDWLNKWRARYGATFGQHYGPHDIEHRMMGENAESVKDIAARLGFAFTVVPRTKDKLGSIQRVRSILPQCQFAVPETSGRNRWAIVMGLNWSKMSPAIMTSWWSRSTDG